MPRTSITIGKCLIGTTLSLIQAGVIMVLSPLVHVRIHPLNIVPLIFVLTVTSFALTGVGVLVAARMTSFQGFGTIMNFVIMPMWFLSGAMFPPQNLPPWLNVLVRINPLNYGVDLIRRLVLNLGYYSPWFDLAFLIVFGSIMVAAAVLAFNRGGILSLKISSISGQGNIIGDPAKEGGSFFAFDLQEEHLDAADKGRRRPAAVR